MNIKWKTIPNWVKRGILKQADDPVIVPNNLKMNSRLELSEGVLI